MNKYLDIIVKRYLTWFLLIIFFVFFSLLSKNFYRFDNLIAIIRDASILGIIVCGLTIVMIAGGLDLSIGASVGLIGLIIAKQVVQQKYGILGILVLPQVMSIIIGYVNGFLFTRLNMPSIIATLATMSIMTGVKLIWFEGFDIVLYDMPKWLFLLSKGFIGPIPISVIIFSIVIFFSSVILYKTRFGRRVYIVGADSNSAFLSGINFKNIRIVTFIYLGILVFISTLITVGRIGGYSSTLGTGYEMEAIFAAVLGGTSLTGGRGTIEGSVAGVLLMSTLRNGLTLIGMSYSLQEVFIGIIFIIFIITQIRFMKILRKS